MSRLKAALDPRSVAIIGASENPNKVGGRPVHYLDKFGFKGRIYPINPSRPEVQGYKCYKSLDDLPEAPEMVIVAVAGDNAIGVVEDCAAHGVKVAVVMASGFGEVDAVAGKAKERQMVEAAHKAGMRIVGPNSQGLANFGTGAIASFSTMFMDMDRAEGHVAMLSQSGALSTVPVGFLRQRGIGVRHTHATGNDADITVGELAVAVAEDPEVKLLLLYLESIPEKKYLEELAAVALDRDLPIIALKSGRSEAGRAAAQSHTGALANEDRVVDAFFEHHGIWRAPDMRGLVEATELYLKGWKPRGRRLVAISNSGAVCVMTADAATAVGMPMAKLADETDKKLKGILPSFATTTNPIDLTAALLSNSRLFGDILPVIAEDPAADAFLIGVPVAGPGYDVEAFARDAAAFGKQTGKPLVIAATQHSVAAQFAAEGSSVFPTETEAVTALHQFLAHRELMARTRARKAARARVNQPGIPVSSTSIMLNEADSLALLAAHGIPVVPHRLCRSRAEGHRGVRDHRWPDRGQGMFGRYRAQVGAWLGETRRQDPRGGWRGVGADGGDHPQARRAVRRRHHCGDGGRPARNHDRGASRSRIRPDRGGRRWRQICRDFPRHHAAAAAVFERRRPRGPRQTEDCAAVRGRARRAADGCRCALRCGGEDRRVDARSRGEGDEPRS